MFQRSSIGRSLEATEEESQGVFSSFFFSLGTFNLGKRSFINRFPENFRFQLTELEYESLRCQIGISKEVDVNVSVRIMRTFVEMRRFLTNNSLMVERINEIEVK